MLAIPARADVGMSFFIFPSLKMAFLIRKQVAHSSYRISCLPCLSSSSLQPFLEGRQGTPNVGLLASISTLANPASTVLLFRTTQLATVSFSAYFVFYIILPLTDV